MRSTSRVQETKLFQWVIPLLALVPFGLTFVLEAYGIGALLVALLSIPIAWRLGDFLLSRLPFERSPEAGERAIFAIGAGLGVISYLTFFIGALGLLRPWPFRLAFGAGLVWSVQGLTKRAQSLGHRGGPRSRLTYPVFGLLALITGICTIAALAPETEFDALNHHLGVVRLYLTAGRIVGTPSLAWSSHPLAVEMLFLFGWLVHSVMAAKLVHLALGLLTAYACVVFCRRYLPPESGFLAALLFLASPLVTYLAQSAYIDLGVALFGLLAVFAFFNWVFAGGTGWAALAGIFAGFASASKYVGAIVPLALVAGLVVILLSRGSTLPRPTWRQAALFCGLSVAVLTPWLIKNLLLVGNPVAPFLSDRISTANLSAGDYQDLVRLSATWRGYSGTLLDYLKSPWLLTFRPDLFHGTPGPAYLFLFPIALVLGWRRKPVRILALLVFFGYLMEILATRNARYFVVLFPWLSVTIAGGIWPEVHGGRGLHLMARRLAVVFALLLVLVQLPWFFSFWPIPHPLTLTPDKISLFRTAEQRRAFTAERVTGPGGERLYAYLQGLPRKAQVLALTPVYQSMTDRTVFMPPNSSASTRLAFEAIDLAQAAACLVTADLELESSQIARFWRLEIPGTGQLTADEKHARLFYSENGGRLEVGVYGVREETGKGGLALTLDLGARRRVDAITLLVQAQVPAPDFRVYVQKDKAGSSWRPVPISSRIVNPRQVDVEEFLRDCRRYGISHLVLGQHAGAAFLGDYFAQAGPRLARRVATFGGYDVFEVGLP